MPRSFDPTPCPLHTGAIHQRDSTHSYFSNPASIVDPTGVPSHPPRYTLYASQRMQWQKIQHQEAEQ